MRKHHGRINKQFYMLIFRSNIITKRPPFHNPFALRVSIKCLAVNCQGNYWNKYMQHIPITNDVFYNKGSLYSINSASGAPHQLDIILIQLSTQPLFWESRGKYNHVWHWGKLMNNDTGKQLVKLNIPASVIAGSDVSFYTWLAGTASREF